MHARLIFGVKKLQNQKNALLDHLSEGRRPSIKFEGGRPPLTVPIWLFDIINRQKLSIAVFIKTKVYCHQDYQVNSSLSFPVLVRVIGICYWLQPQ